VNPGGRVDRSFESRGAGLLSDQPEIPDILRVRGVVQVINLQMLRRSAVLPVVIGVVGDEVGDAGVAFPPVLVGIAEMADDGLGELRVGWIGDVVNLL